MPNHESTEKTIVQRMVNRVGNPLEWRWVDKVLIIIGIQVVAFGSLLLYLCLAIRFPEILANCLNPSAVTDFLKINISFLLLYGIYALLAYRFRKRSPNSKWLAYSFAVILSIHTFIFVAGIGYATNPVTFLCIISQAIFGLLLFDIYFSLLILCTWGLMLVIQISGELFGLLKYAPYLIEPPFMDGKIDNLWLIWNMGGGTFAVVVTFILFAYTINRWHKREEQVIELSELLKKMFGRYLSVEVMNSLIENPSTLELGGGRRKVTIMMTDLRGFTALSERLEPERVVQMLNSYFEIMVDVVFKYNGTIIEIIGDALLVIFGAPQEMPDRARRAIACAIDMQNAMVKANQENRAGGLPDLEMGIGLNEAEVIVGNIGSSKRSKYAVVGRGVNMAGRIESYTVGGQILISESVKQEAGEIIRIDGQKEVMPKGAEAPLTIYEVGGIAGPYNLALEGRDPAPAALALQIPLRYTVLEGKDVGRKDVEGFIIRLSKNSAEIICSGPVEILANLKMNLGDVDEKLSTRDFYGKAIRLSEANTLTYIVRFTSVPPEVDGYLQAFRKHAVKPGDR